MDTSKSRSLGPINTALAQFVDYKVVESHSDSIGHVCPTVKAQKPVYLNYSSMMSKNKPMCDVLASNLEALMKNNPKYSSNDKLGARCKMPGRTIGRIRNSETSTRLDTIEKLAEAFGLEAWQMLVPDFDPTNLPVLPKTDTERRLYAAIQEGFRKDATMKADS